MLRDEKLIRSIHHFNGPGVQEEFQKILDDLISQKHDSLNDVSQPEAQLRATLGELKTLKQFKNLHTSIKDARERIQRKV